MSVIYWTAEELGNVARFLTPQDDFCGTLKWACRNLAKVSRANVGEFIDTYANRHGTPVAHTAEEIQNAAPKVAHRADALSTLELLDYNANPRDAVLRAEAAEALVWLLGAALPRPRIAAPGPRWLVG